MNKKNLSSTALFSSSWTRLGGYILVFVSQTIILEVMSYFTPIRSSIPAVIVLALSLLIGLLFICEQNILSRITSAATLFLLGIIAIKFNHSLIAPAFLLALSLLAAWLGAQPFAHRKPPTASRTVWLSMAVIAAAFIFVMAFIYITIIISNIINAHYLQSL